MLVLTLGRKKQIVVRNRFNKIILRFFMTSDKSQEVRLGIKADKKYAISREPKGESDGTEPNTAGSTNGLGSIGRGNAATTA